MPAIKSVTPKQREFAPQKGNRWDQAAGKVPAPKPKLEPLPVATSGGAAKITIQKQPILAPPRPVVGLTAAQPLLARYTLPPDERKPLGGLLTDQPKAEIPGPRLAPMDLVKPDPTEPGPDTDTTPPKPVVQAFELDAPPNGFRAIPLYQDLVIDADPKQVAAAERFGDATARGIPPVIAERFFEAQTDAKSAESTQRLLMFGLAAVALWALAG